MNQVIKNNGKRVEFNINKLRQAIDKTNVSCNNVLQEDDIVYIINKTVSKLQKINRDVNTDEISDILEQILSKVDFNVAKSYIEYRYEKREFRNKSEIDARINEVLDNTNEEVKQENSNKNPTILSVQRDYVAGEYSRYYTNKYIIPKDLAKAHEEGIIHIHDEDYMIHREHNCCLVNLEDMLQNGTNISGYHIDKPHSFRVACTLASQISAVVASNQYGGQTITLSHLAPFVEVSRKAIKERLNKIDGLDTKLKNKILQVELEQEVRQGIQSLQYEYTTLQTTNGQAPFITVFMYLNEVKDEQTKKDLAWIIQIMLEQRIKGVKDTSGIWVNPSFPKLIYVLDKDNIKEGTEYFWLTKLAAECSAKRMVPDYISAKVMKELKGDVYSCMGCLDYNETIKITTRATDYGYNTLSQTVKIGDLYEHISRGNNGSRYYNSKLLNRAKNIENIEDRNKFIKNGYVLYSGDSFNQWAINFYNQNKRKATKQDFKDFCGSYWDRMSVMTNRGADMNLVSRWDSYFELKVCDLLNMNNCEQKYSVEECHNRYDYMRNKIFVCKDNSRKQIDIYFPNLNIGFEINDFTTHSKDSDSEPYVTENGVKCHIEDYNGYKKGPKYSQNKINSFKELGIQIIEIWEDEIKDKSFIGKINNHLKTNFQLKDITTATKFNGLYKYTNPVTDVIDLEQSNIIKYVEDIDGSYTKIKKIMRNSNVSNWIKITTENRTIIVTTDHPLIIETGQIIAGELNIGDYILNNKEEREYITNIELINKVDYSYDIETETSTFVFSDILSHNCRSFLTPDRFSDIKGNLSNSLNYDKIIDENCEFIIEE